MGKNTAKERGIFSSHPYTTTPSTTCFPRTAAQRRPPLRSPEAEATYQLLPERGHRGRGRGEPPPPAHLPRLRTLRLRWRAGRHCPCPRKPPAPPAAAEASQRLGIATAAVAVAALLPRCSRSSPASTGVGPTARRGRGSSQHQPRCVAPSRSTGDRRRASSLFLSSYSQAEEETYANGKGVGLK